MEKLSLYFHIPFCTTRCGYCDFNTFAGMQTLIPKYVKAMQKEVRWAASNLSIPVQVGTIFLGGGTPSLLSTGQLQDLMKTVRDAFELTPDFEATLEANPGTVDENWLGELRGIGFNRISFGMQSAHPDDLRVLNRQHVHPQVIDAVLWSKKAGFEHINLDLIFGIPAQSLKRWQQTLELALMENVDHLSLYSLTVEEGTPLNGWVRRGVLPAPDDDLSGEMFETAMRVLVNAGYEQYEISNWARRGGVAAQCRHNLQYWRFLPYLGFGAGAHGFFENTRTENSAGILDYIKKIEADLDTSFPGGPASIRTERLDLWDAIQEYMMVGFRLTEEGISLTAFEKRFSCSAELLFKKQIAAHLKNGLIERHPLDHDRLRLTQKGILLGNRVFASFIGNRKPEGWRISP